MEKIIEAKSNDILMALFGSYDKNIKLIEKELDVQIVNRDVSIKIMGENCEKAAQERRDDGVYSLLRRGICIGKTT